jgi:hypothetical protein
MTVPQLSFENHDAAAVYLLARTVDLQEHVVHAMGNLQIAQHKDQRRYKHIHSGDYKPAVRTFKAGDFVYRKRPEVLSTLQTKYKPEIYRVKELRDSGVAVLQGMCGNTFTYHADNLAPCNLPNIDGTIDPTLAAVSVDHACEVCNSPDDGHRMALCDSCNDGYHDHCVAGGIPHLGDHSVVWVCPVCTGKGITGVDVLSRKDRQLLMPQEPLIFLTPEQMQRDDEAKALDGRIIVVRKDQLVNGKKAKVPVDGVLEFVGRDGQRNPKYFIAKYVDGTTEPLTLATAKRRLVDRAVAALALAAPCVLPRSAARLATEYSHITGLPVGTRDAASWLSFIADACESEHAFERMTVEDVVQLRCMVDYSGVCVVQDVFDTCQLLWPLFRQNSVSHFAALGLLDAHTLMSPSSQAWMHERIESDLIILNGNCELTQYLLPITASVTGVTVVAKLPSSVIFNPAPVMAQWLTRETKQGRIMLLGCYGDADHLWLVHTEHADVLCSCTADDTNPPFTHKFDLPRGLVP